MIVIVNYSIALAMVVAFAQSTVLADGDPFAKLKKTVDLPAELKAVYEEFIKVSKSDKASEKLSDFLLPGAIGITARPRKSGQEWNIENDLNIPFLQSRKFAASVESMKQGDGDTIQLNTQSTAFWFVQTKSGKWKIYKTYDRLAE